MKNPMWSNKDGRKYHPEELKQLVHYSDADDCNLLLINPNNLYPNILDVRNQLKTLDDEQ